MSAEEIAQRVRPITEERAIESYKELKDLPCRARPDLLRQGAKAIDFLTFKHRLATKTKRRSFLDTIRNKSSKDYKYLLAKTRKYRKWDSSKPKTRDAKLADMYTTFQLLFGSVNTMRASYAKYIYCLVKPKMGILDPSAGWTARAMAAMSMGIPYIGIDSNKSLKPAYDKMVKLYEPAADVTMIFKPSESVDFSKYKYDCIFTSTAYSNLEVYEHMPSYKDDQDFINTFFIPTFKKAWTHLQNGGYMCLNIPEWMYDTIKGCLPKVYKKVKYPIMDRHATQAVKGNALDVGKTSKHEFTYIWHKVRNTAFDEEAKGCGIAP